MNDLNPEISGWDRMLSQAWLDRSVAVIAAAPFAWVMWLYLQVENMPLEMMLIVINLATITVTMLLRHPPRRVTSNPGFWLLALIASYWLFFTRGFYLPGERLAPQWLTLSVVVIGFLLTIWARLSLGRNIGLVPAQREIVSTGAYRWVRHPIYTGIFLSLIASTLADYAPRNLMLSVIWAGLFAYKSFVEEGFLKQSEEYAEYMRKVRWRWVPFVV
ncbi:isoprenylcysteine carboxylmethyltransferase family protein [soil metagenome]